MRLQTSKFGNHSWKFGSSPRIFQERQPEIIRSSPKKSNFSRLWMCKIPILKCYFNNNNTKQIVIKNSKKSSNQQKNTKKMSLKSLSESETIDKSQNSFQKEINARLLLIFVSLYSIPSHLRKKNQIKKNLLAVIMYNVWNSKIVPIMNVFFLSHFIIFLLLLTIPL